MTVQEILERLDGVHKTGDQWIARCPAHADRKPSLSVGIGRDDRVLLTCHAGCSFEQVIAALGPGGASQKGSGRGSTIRETYDYTDEEGQLLFQVVRFEPKDFRQRRLLRRAEPWRSARLRAQQRAFGSRST